MSTSQLESTRNAEGGGASRALPKLVTGMFNAHHFGFVQSMKTVQSSRFCHDTAS